MKTQRSIHIYIGAMLLVTMASLGFTNPANANGVTVTPNSKATVYHAVNLSGKICISIMHSDGSGQGTVDVWENHKGGFLGLGNLEHGRQTGRYCEDFTGWITLRVGFADESSVVKVTYEKVKPWVGISFDVLRHRPL